MTTPPEPDLEPAVEQGLSVRSISHRFRLGDAEPVDVLRDVSFAMTRGESRAIIGPSGSGKSTLLHIIGSLMPPTSGTVHLGDVDVTRLSGNDAADFRNHRVGFIFQEHHLLPQLTVLDNVLIPVLAGRKVNDDDIASAGHWIDQVGLSDRRDHRPGQLSGGQRERAAIARALMMDPDMLLADEPTGNLDRRTGDTIGELLRSLTEDHSKILIAVTHSDRLAGIMSRCDELVDGILQPVTR